MTASETDASNKSYYGEQKLHFLTANGSIDCLVPLPKVGQCARFPDMEYSVRISIAAPSWSCLAGLPLSPAQRFWDSNSLLLNFIHCSRKAWIESKSTAVSYSIAIACVNLIYAQLKRDRNILHEERKHWKVCFCRKGQCTMSSGHPVETISWQSAATCLQKQTCLALSAKCCMSSALGLTILLDGIHRSATSLKLSMENEKECGDKINSQYWSTFL